MSIANMQAVGLVSGTLGIYLPSQLTDAYGAAACASDSFVVVKGLAGARRVKELRGLGVVVPILIDPAEYEPLAKNRGEFQQWYELQQEHQVPAYVSPGTYLHLGNETEWVAEVDEQSSWCDIAPGEAFASVCVHTDALISGGLRLHRALRRSAHPVWLTLAHRNDPLSKLSAVQGLVDLVTAAPNVVVMRSDLAAIGAVAHGARLGSVGVSSSVRHASTGGGGGQMSSSASVFVPTLLDWKKVDILLSWIQRDADVAFDLLCLEDCCQGQSLTRFADPALVGGVVEHNMTALAGIHRAIVDLSDPISRRQKFASLAGNASFQADRLAAMIPGIRPSSQVKQWRDLVG